MKNLARLVACTFLGLVSLFGVSNAKASDLADKLIQNSSHISYKAEERGKDFWQSYAVTEQTREGDCEDIAIHAANTLKQEGKEPLILILNDSRQNKAHAITVINHKPGYELVDAEAKLKTQIHDSLNSAILEYECPAEEYEISINSDKYYIVDLDKIPNWQTSTENLFQYTGAKKYTFIQKPVIQKQTAQEIQPNIPLMPLLLLPLTFGTAAALTSNIIRTRKSNKQI